MSSRNAGGIGIIVHGGAKKIPPEQEEAHRRGCANAVDAGWAVLERGGSALDAAEAAIRVLEDDPTFNAGYGSTLNAVGDVEMDAGLMEGGGFRAGAVGGIAGVRNPIAVARKLVDENTVLLVAEPARRFAAEHGLPLCAPDALITAERRREWEEERKKRSDPHNDTVGCVALDRHGNVAAGASTGGRGMSPAGRVGDSPLVGSGFYADNRFGGCSTTGDGESIMRVVLARTAVDLIRDGTEPDEAAERALGFMCERVEGEAGCILLDKNGRPGWAHNSPEMAMAYRTGDMREPVACVRKETLVPSGW